MCTFCIILIQAVLIFFFCMMNQFRYKFSGSYHVLSKDIGIWGIWMIRYVDDEPYKVKKFSIFFVFVCHRLKDFAEVLFLVWGLFLHYWFCEQWSYLKKKKKQLKTRYSTDARDWFELCQIHNLCFQNSLHHSSNVINRFLLDF